jgi:hypothetical protein
MGLVPKLPPIQNNYRILLRETIKLRGVTCEFCGQNAAPIAGKGKLRARHLCPHGAPCERGKSEDGVGRWRGNGTHANHPTCPECLKARNASTD